MLNTWKITSIFVLLLVGMMQVLPFVPTHVDCKDACSVATQSCCEEGAATGCEVAMTSCSASLFLPLISAPLLKVESTVQLDAFVLTLLPEPAMLSQIMALPQGLDVILEAPPPTFLPLLI